MFDIYKTEKIIINNQEFWGHLEHISFDFDEFMQRRNLWKIIIYSENKETMDKFQENVFPGATLDIKYQEISISAEIMKINTNRFFSKNLFFADIEARS